MLRGLICSFKTEANLSQIVVITFININAFFGLCVYMREKSNMVLTKVSLIQCNIKLTTHYFAGGLVELVMTY